MTELTHEEARRLIQFDTDHVLDHKKRSPLAAHLAECKECRAYADELKELENKLQRAMQHKWSLSPAPLPVYTILTQAKTKHLEFPSNAMVTRTAVIALAFLVILFGTWQFSRTNSTYSPMLTFALPVPTPSTYLTSTDSLFPGCNYILYQVRENDTLQGIARQFAVSKDDIILINNIRTKTLLPSTQIRVPLCNSTATGTIHAPTGTITITPQFEPHTSTPG